MFWIIRNNELKSKDCSDFLFEDLKKELIGPSDGLFNRPSDVAVDQDGFIYVADWGNQRVQVFDHQWNFHASLRGQATVSPWAQEYLEANADELDARSRFDPYIEVDTDDEHEISARVEAYFWDPIAVEIDPEGRLVVADSLRHRLQIYHCLLYTSPSPRD